MPEMLYASHVACQTHNIKRNGTVGSGQSVSVTPNHELIIILGECVSGVCLDKSLKDLLLEGRLV